jgi:hypothetical protein
LGVARRFECSEVARTAYGACASDRRSVGAWTERAPNLRGREGVKRHEGPDSGDASVYGDLWAVRIQQLLALVRSEPRSEHELNAIRPAIAGHPAP